jgi:hypothetical protein
MIGFAELVGAVLVFGLPAVAAIIGIILHLK